MATTRKRRKKKKRRVDPFIVDDDEDFLDDEADYNPNKKKLEAPKKSKKRKLKKKAEPKKKRRKKMSQGTKKRRRRGLTPEGEGSKDGSTEDLEDFRSIEEHLKTQSKGRRGDIDEGLAADESKQLLKGMTDALLLDRQSVDKGEIPFYRLLLLPELREKASKLYLQLALIEDGILEVMADWLTPYKGKLCNLEVRTTVLDLLSSFPIEGIDKDKLSLLRDQGTFGGITLNKLKKSNIGQMISFLSQQDEETPKNKKTCKILIEKFSRLIHGLGDSFEDDLERSKREGFSRMKTVVSYAGKTDLEPKDVGFITRATAPRVIGYDFVKKPQMSSKRRSRIGGDTTSEIRQSESKEVLDKRMMNISKKRKSFSSKYNR